MSARTLNNITSECQGTDLLYAKVRGNASKVCSYSCLSTRGGDFTKLCYFIANLL